MCFTGTWKDAGVFGVSESLGTADATNTAAQALLGSCWGAKGKREKKSRTRNRRARGGVPRGGELQWGEKMYLRNDQMGVPRANTPGDLTRKRGNNMPAVSKNSENRRPKGGESPLTPIQLDKQTNAIKIHGLRASDKMSAVWKGNQ